MKCRLCCCAAMIRTFKDKEKIIAFPYLLRLSPTNRRGRKFTSEKVLLVLDCQMHLWRGQHSSVVERQLSTHAVLGSQVRNLPFSFLLFEHSCQKRKIKRLSQSALSCGSKGMHAPNELKKVNQCTIGLKRNEESNMLVQQTTPMPVGHCSCIFVNQACFNLPNW